MNRLILILFFAVPCLVLPRCKLMTDHQSMANLTLTDRNNENQFVFNKTSKVNMLIFWASWCAPCRKEIPALKEMYEKYKSKGLNMVSISIDWDRRKWELALDQEKMEWPQFIVDSIRYDEINRLFDFTSIPLVIFADGNANQFRRIVGARPNQKEFFCKILDEELAMK